MPALIIEEFVRRLRLKGASTAALDPQLLQVATFGHYCGSVAGGGHVDFVCNNEETFFDRISLAEKGAKRLGLDGFADILADDRGLLPSADKTDVYAKWAKDEGQYALLEALDIRLFSLKFGTAKQAELAASLSRPAQVGFEAAIKGDQFSASDPHYACLYAWLARYPKVRFGTFHQANEETDRIITQLTSG